jgi:hypothetical protein
LRYVIDFARVPTDEADNTPRYIITWARLADGANPHAAWRELEQRVRELLQGNHLPSPP